MRQDNSDMGEMMRLLLKALAGCCCLLLIWHSDAAAIDAPHGASGNMGCGSCHGKDLLSSPFWSTTDDETYNNLCLLNCHNASSAPYTETSSPRVKTHSSANTSDTYGTWSVRCVDCHDPHAHQQKNWQKKEPAKLFLATGQVTGLSYDAGSGNSTMTYSSLAYKSGWDAPSLLAKSSAARRAVFFPNIKKTGFSYPIVAIDSPAANTITVEGDVSAAYTYVSLPTNFGVIYGQYIQQYITVGGSNVAVKFFGPTGSKSFADGDATKDGVCEVCHTQTTHWSPAAVGGGDVHYPGQDCTQCHSHAQGFGHGGDGSGAICASCHVSGAHSGHLAKDMACSACHDLANMRDGNGDLVDPRLSGVCATCHNNGRGGNPNHTDYTTGWDNPAYDLSCDGCHNGRPLVDALVMATDAHERLVGEAGIRRYPCYYCHDESVSPASALLAKHCNGVKDVAIDGQWAIQDQDPVALPAYDSGTKVCSNTYCHSDGTIVDPEVRPYPWSGGAESCNSCHGHDPAQVACSDCHDDGRSWAATQEWLSAMPMYANTGAGTARANSHYRHLFTGFSCDDCHFSTVVGGCLDCHTDANGDPVVPAGQMGDVAHVNGTFHVNTEKDVVFKNGGSYDSGSKTCSSTVCHTGGTDPVWGGSVSTAVTCLECHGAPGADVDDFGEFNGTQARIGLPEWGDTGHGRPTASGNYPQSGNPPANFPTNGCWYCHDNNVLHQEETNPYRLRKHTHFENRFAKECVYCHMEDDADNPGLPEESQCLFCHDDATGATMAPQLLDTGAQGQINAPYLVSRPDHAPYSGGGTACRTCHSDDEHRHKSGSDLVWTAAQKLDVQNQYVQMGVCLICHDDDSGGQCISCHATPADNPATPEVDESLTYALGFDPGISGLPRIAAQSKASSVHFGYKHYASYQNNGVWKGGKFCWDCHDPHGDGNIYMVQNEVATATDGVYGKPTARAEVSFTRKQSGLDYARINTPYNGICNVCHTDPAMYYRSDFGSGHNAGRLCTSCHEHRFTDSHADEQSCNTCHQNKPVPRHTAFGQPRDCVKCHAGAIGKRMDIMGQFNANSHHVQGTTLTGKHCYSCHWEATEFGLIDPDYHAGYNPNSHASTKDAAVDLVIWGPGLRPTVYDSDGALTGSPTASVFLASDISGTLAVQRAAVDKITPHCLGCHSDQNNETTPFDGDCRVPRQYAWDRASIAARYSDATATTWGKYTGTANAAAKNLTKSFSAHGNAVNNAGGFDPATGLDGAITNTRGGGYNVQCFDCHSSHGSKAVGTTSSYKTFNGTQNGGNLKETQAGKGGYGMTYTASANGNPASVNPYKTGAGQCFDCHETAAAGTTPWGYNSTFGATQPIKGYTDTPRFGQGTRGAGTRYPYKSSTVTGGHFKASSALGSSPMATVNGLCTPCHDPHGVTPSLPSADRQYAVPLLKGTWMTSPYKEDVATAGGTTGKRGAQAMNPSPTPTPGVNLDQNTFGGANRITEDAARFAGLCLGCHQKGDLTDGVNNNGAWKSVDRLHESVKGWGDNEKHSYSCSKCHLPHSSTLPRLMATNCLNTSHRGRVASGGVPGDNESVWRYNSCRTVLKTVPASFPLGKGTSGGNMSKFRVNCHPTGTWPDNSWNTKTPW